MTGASMAPVWATILVAGLAASCGGGAVVKDQGAALTRPEAGRLSDDPIKRHESSAAAREPPTEIPEECRSSDQGGCPTNSWVRDWTPSDRRIARSGIRGRGCRDAPECRERGRCASHAPGECYEATSDSCKRSFYCEYEGLCKESEGVLHHHDRLASARAEPGATRRTQTKTSFTATQPRDRHLEGRFVAQAVATVYTACRGQRV